MSLGIRRRMWTFSLVEAPMTGRWRSSTSSGKTTAKNIKLGLIEDLQSRDKLAPLTRWYTTNNVTKLASLDEYLSRMKSGNEGQKKIYFLGGEDRNTLQHSPLIEKLVK